MLDTTSWYSSHFSYFIDIIQVNISPNVIVFFNLNHSLLTSWTHVIARTWDFFHFPFSTSVAFFRYIQYQVTFLHHVNQRGKIGLNNNQLKIAYFKSRFKIPFKIQRSSQHICYIKNWKRWEKHWFCHINLCGKCCFHNLKCQLILGLAKKVKWGTFVSTQKNMKQW